MGEISEEIWIENINFIPIVRLQCQYSIATKQLVKVKIMMENKKNDFMIKQLVNKFRLFLQYKSKKIAPKTIKGLNINVAGKYLAVLLIDTSPYKYGFLTFPKP